MIKTLKDKTEAEALRYAKEALNKRSDFFGVIFGYKKGGRAHYYEFPKVFKSYDLFRRLSTEIQSELGGDATILVLYQSNKNNVKDSIIDKGVNKMNLKDGKVLQLFEKNSNSSRPLKAQAVEHNRGVTFISPFPKEDKDFDALDEVVTYAEGLGYKKVKDSISLNNIKEIIKPARDLGFIYVGHQNGKHIFSFDRNKTPLSNFPKLKKIGKSISNRFSIEINGDEETVEVTDNNDLINRDNEEISIYNQFKKDDSVVKRYKSGDEKIDIVKASNGKFFIEYPSSVAGPFDSFEEAERTLKKHRSNAKEINDTKFKNIKDDSNLVNKVEMVIKSRGFNIIKSYEGNNNTTFIKAISREDDAKRQAQEIDRAFSNYGKVDVYYDSGNLSVVVRDAALTFTFRLLNKIDKSKEEIKVKASDIKNAKKEVLKKLIDLPNYAGTRNYWIERVEDNEGNHYLKETSLKDYKSEDMNKEIKEAISKLGKDKIEKYASQLKERGGYRDFGTRLTWDLLNVAFRSKGRFLSELYEKYGVNDNHLESSGRKALKELGISLNDSKTFKVTHNNKSYKVKAKDHKDAVTKLTKKLKDSDSIDDIGKFQIGNKYRWEERYGNTILTLIENDRDAVLSLDLSNAKIFLEKEKFEKLVKEEVIRELDGLLLKQYNDGSDINSLISKIKFLINKSEMNPNDSTLRDFASEYRYILKQPISYLEKNKSLIEEDLTMFKEDLKGFRDSKKLKDNDIITKEIMLNELGNRNYSHNSLMSEIAKKYGYKLINGIYKNYIVINNEKYEPLKWKEEKDRVVHSYIKVKDAKLKDDTGPFIIVKIESDGRKLKVSKQFDYSKQAEEYIKSLPKGKYQVISKQRNVITTVEDSFVNDVEEILQEFDKDGIKGYITRTQRGNDTYYIAKSKLDLKYFKTPEDAKQHLIKLGFKDGKEINDKLIQSSSKEALQKNIETEIKAGKDPKQASAIAYSVQRKNK